MIKMLAFDLDNTLYEESQFLQGGIRAIAVHLGSRYGIQPSQAETLLGDTCQASGRGSMLAEVIQFFQLPCDCLADLVQIYRTHEPRLELYSGYRELLTNLAEHYPMALITDGRVEVQERKVKALGLERWMNPIIYGWQEGPENGKPSPRPFIRLLEAVGLLPVDVAYIGDNPAKDFAGARAVGLLTVRVLTGPNREVVAESATAADFTIPDLLSLPQLLSRLGGTESNSSTCDSKEKGNHHVDGQHRK